MQRQDRFTHRPYLRLALAWVGGCYLVTAGYLVYQFAAGKGVYYSYPRVDVLQWFLSPLLIPGMLSDATHSIIMGRISPARFLLIYAIVLPPFLFVFWALGRLGSRDVAAPTAEQTQVMKARSFRSRSAGLGLLLLAAAFIGVYRWSTRGAFDSAVWRDETRFESGDRLPMAERLVESKALVGKTRPEVVELLGEPNDPKRATATQLMYRLAPIKGWPNVQAQWLVVGINGDTGRVTEAIIVAE